MRLKEKIIKDIEQLEPGLLPVVHDYIKSLKRPAGKEKVDGKGSPVSHKDIQKLLASSKSNWSEDLSQEREDRI